MKSQVLKFGLSLNEESIMITVDITVSRQLRVKPLEDELVVVMNNRSITVMFKEAMANAAVGLKTIVYVHTKNMIKPFYLRSMIRGDHDIEAEVTLSPRIDTFYSSRIDIWIDRRNKVIIYHTEKEESSGE